MKLVGITFLLMVNIGLGLSQGLLRCWECENQASEDACSRNGREKVCDANQRSCENQIRSTNFNTQVLITKRCKQSHACANNELQNLMSGWKPTQCNGDTQANTCTCCCSTNLCNQNVTFCETTTTTTPPTTTPEPMCPDLGDIENGTRVCTRGNSIGSDCTFTCNMGFELFPASSMTLRCQSNATWNGTKPCCLRQCQRNGFFDVVFALDSSTSVGPANWALLQTFVSEIINNFTIGPNAARIGVFQFSTFIGFRSQILLNAYPNDRAGLIQAVRNIPYNGGVTRTGTAIRYARRVMFNPANGDRPLAPNVLVVITDGMSQQRRLVRNAAQAIRAAGVSTFAVRIGTNLTPPERREINAIAGSPRNVLQVERLDGGRLTELANEVERFICSSRTCNN